MLFGLLLSQFGLCVLSSSLALWLFMVLATLCSVGWLRSFLPSSTLALYFVVSVMSSLLFLMSFVDVAFSPLFLCLSLFLIMGLAPFQFWVLSLLSHLSSFPLITFLGPTKLGYLFLVICHSRSSLILGTFSLIFGLLYLYFANSLALILYSSSSALILPLMCIGSDMFWYFQLTYLLALSTFYFYFFSAATSIFCFFCLLGLPPLGIFFAKLAALSVLPPFHALVLICISAFIVNPYMRIALFLGIFGQTSFLLAFTLTALPAYLAS